MKTLFISDLHLGSSLFKSDDIVMELLSDGSYDKIILIGDIIDTWESTTSRIVKKNKELIAKINSLNNVVIIRGNHDPSLDRMAKIFTNAPLIANREPYVDGDMLMIHGDEFDKLVTEYSFLAKLLYPIQLALSKLGINPKAMVRNTLHSIACHKEKKYYNDLVTDVEENLANKYKSSCKVLIAGHTHLPKLIIRDGFTYVNCGDWVHNRTYAECIDGKFTIRKENGDDFFK